MTNPNQRFSVGLVPTLPTNPPLPDAAPAADAGERVAALEAEVERLRLGWKADAATLDAWMEKTRNLNSRVGVLKSERDEARRLARPYQQRAEDEATSAGRLAVDLCSALARAEAAEAERDRLSAELAALRGAMPDPQMLDMYAEGIEWEGYDASGLRKAAAAIRAALATVTATPQAAGTGTGGEDQGADWTDCDCGLCAQCNGQAIRQAPVWTREAPIKPGEYWAIVDRWSEPAPQMVSLKVAEAGDTWWASDSYDDTYGYSPRQILLWGPIAVTSIPPGWREALAALDTPREADHAR